VGHSAAKNLVRARMSAGQVGPAEIALLTIGLDPGLGFFHVDYRSRDSFALNLMETARPDVDRFVLQLIQT
jgi:CRISPR/Cas system-associated endonuclease Cas1